MRLVNAATGFDWKDEDIDKHGVDIYDLERLLSTREGITGADDTLPSRIMKEALKGGNSDGVSIGEENFQSMLQEYYQLHGWDENGIPTDSV